VTLEYSATPPGGIGYLPVAFADACATPAVGDEYRMEDTWLVRGDVWAFQQGALPRPEYDGCQDAHILLWEPYRDNNTGACVQIEEGNWWNRGEQSNWDADHKRILIRFDLSSLPSTFSLASAHLQLYALGERRSGRRNKHTIYAARLLRPWGEGEGTHFDGLGYDTRQGEVTGSSAEHGLVPWEKPGAMGESDVALAESSATVGVNWPEWVTLDVTDSVQYFLDNPDKNFGWKISQDPVHGVDDPTIEYVAGAYMYKSSEAPEVHLRPMLVLVPSETVNDE
jgi:hypothetical protein